MLDSLIDKVNVNHDIKVILGGDLNFHFNSPLEADGGRPSLKLSSLALFKHLAKKWDLCDMWRVRNPDCKRFTYRQKIPFLQRHLDYFFISDELPEIVSKVDVLPSLRSDHSPIYMKYVDSQSGMQGNSYWKFNTSLLSNPEFISSMKEKIEEVIRKELGNIEDPRTKLEILKYRIRQFSTHFSKKLSKERKEKRLSEVQTFEKHVYLYSSEDKLKDYEQAKSELEEIYNLFHGRYYPKITCIVV